MKHLILSLICGILILTGCSAGAEPPKEITDTAVYEQTEAVIEEAVTDTENGTIRIYFTFKNNGSVGMYMYESFAVRAFQDDVQLTEVTDINDDPESASVLTEVKDGESIRCSYVFQLNSASSVEVRICTPTADEELLAQKIFPVSEE